MLYVMDLSHLSVLNYFHLWETVDNTGQGVEYLLAGWVLKTMNAKTGRPSPRRRGLTPGVGDSPTPNPHPAMDLYRQYRKANYMYIHFPSTDDISRASERRISPTDDNNMKRSPAENPMRYM